MRAVLLCLLVAGCGKPAAVPEGEGKAAALPKPPSGPPIEYDSGYETNPNPFASDAKYKGKLVRSPRVEIDRVSRTRDGRAYVAPLSVLTTAGVPEPCYFYFMADDEAAKVIPGKRYDIVGECLGYERDDLWRGGIGSMNWHVDFVNCKVLPATPAPKKK